MTAEALQLRDVTTSVLAEVQRIQNGATKRQEQFEEFEARLNSRMQNLLRRPAASTSANRDTADDPLGAREPSAQSRASPCVCEGEQGLVVHKPASRSHCDPAASSSHWVRPHVLEVCCKCDAAQATTQAGGMRDMDEAGGRICGFT